MASSCRMSKGVPVWFELLTINVIFSVISLSFTTCCSQPINLISNPYKCVLAKVFASTHMYGLIIQHAGCTIRHTWTNDEMIVCNSKRNSTEVLQRKYNAIIDLTFIFKSNFRRPNLLMVSSIIFPRTKCYNIRTPIQNWIFSRKILLHR